MRGPCRHVVLILALCLVMCPLMLGGMPKPKSGGTLDLITLSPEAGTSVGRDSVITAELRFTIDNFKNKKDRYHISIQFVTKGSRAATFSKDPGNVVMLNEASGTITLAYPLDHVWDDPQLRKPLTIYFFLHERTGTRGSVVLDQTDQIHFSVREADQPA